MTPEPEPIGPQLPEGNHISQLAESTPDLEPRLPNILPDVLTVLEDNFYVTTNHQGQPIIEYSRWWGEKAGAARIQGTYRVSGVEKPAILRIEGAHIPAPDEWMLPHVRSAFSADSDFVIPQLFWAQSWTDGCGGYSVSVIEAIEDTSPLFTIPPTSDELIHFFDVWKKYRKVINKKDFQPWIQKPPEGLAISIQKAFDTWRQREAVKVDFAERPSDGQLINNAIKTLVHEYQNVEPVFMHTHFGKDDIVENDGKYIFRANLYWDWKAPFYDAVFAYHWAMLELANDQNISPTDLPQRIEEIRKLWQDQMEQLTTTPEEKRLLQLALLERATAGLLQDTSLVYERQRREIAQQFEREQIQKLLQELQ